MVIDSSALIAILLGDPECDALAVALAGAEMPVICAPNWLEAMMVSCPYRAQGLRRAREACNASGQHSRMPSDASVRHRRELEEPPGPGCRRGSSGASRWKSRLRVARRSSRSALTTTTAAAAAAGSLPFVGAGDPR
jgi:hypothetical protein